MTAPVVDAKNNSPGKPGEGDPCPHCGSTEPWGRASWCPACGYYPALGGTTVRTAEEAAESEGGEAWESLNDGPANLMEAIPKWAWFALGGAIVIIAANIALRVAVPMKPSLQTLLTLAEFSLGVVMAGFSHFSAYLFAAYKSDKYGPFDFFMKPIEIWKPTLKKTQLGMRRLCGMSWGCTAIFAALLVLGGFEFDSMFDDWGFEQPEPPNLVHGVVKKARKKKAADEDLAGSIKKFVGEGELEEEPELLETKCVILGYFKTEQGELASLVLGSAPRGRLAYVGLLSKTDIPEESRPDVLKALEGLNELKSCYVKDGVPLKSAIWVEPKLLCLVEHTSWNTQYRLQQPKFLKLVSPEDEKKEQEKKERKEQAESELQEKAEELTKQLE